MCKKPAYIVYGLYCIFILTLEYVIIFNDVIQEHLFSFGVNMSLIRGLSLGGYQLPNADVQYAIAVCQDKVVPGKAFEENDRQYSQIKAMFKSAAILTSTVIRFNIITDSDDVYKQLVNITFKWPPNYRKKLTFAPRRDVIYPPQIGSLRNEFRPCASARLFMSESLTDVEAVVYVDSDTYFMQPPEQLWNLFKHFDERQIAGVTPHFDYYKPPFNSFPVFGHSGLNSGVLMMNLTRIRNYPNGWINSIKDIITTRRDKLVFFDQDILNILFGGENAKYAFEIPCEWNYLPLFCGTIRNICPTAAVNGIALVHGNAFAFNHAHLRFTAVFLEWGKFDMQLPLQDLVTNMERALNATTGDLCKIVPNINEILLKGMKKYLL